MQLALDLAGRVRGLAGLVVEHHPARAERVAVDPVDLPGDREAAQVEAALKLRRRALGAERDLEAVRDERRGRLGLVPDELLQVAGEPGLELAPLQVRQVEPHVRLDRVAQALAQELERLREGLGLDALGAGLLRQALEEAMQRLVRDRPAEANVHQALHGFFKGLPKKTGAERVQPETLPQALELGECLSDAIKAHVRLDLPDLERRELEAGLAATWSARPARGRVALAARPAPFRGLVRLRALGAGAPARPRPGRLRDLREDRSDRPRPVGTRGMVLDNESARPRTRRARSRASSTYRSPSTCWSYATSSGSSRSAASTARSAARARHAASCGPRRATTASGLPRNDYLDEDAFWGQVDRAKGHAQAVVERIRSGDVRHDPKGGPFPTWCDRWPCAG